MYIFSALLIVYFGQRRFANLKVPSSNIEFTTDGDMMDIYLQETAEGKIRVSDFGMTQRKYRHKLVI